MAYDHTVNSDGDCRSCGDPCILDVLPLWPDPADFPQYLTV